MKREIIPEPHTVKNNLGQYDNAQKMFSGLNKTILMGTAAAAAIWYFFLKK